jgi:hypothetical protein
MCSVITKLELERLPEQPEESEQLRLQVCKVVLVAALGSFLGQLDAVGSSNASEPRGFMSCHLFSLVHVLVSAVRLELVRGLPDRVSRSAGHERGVDGAHGTMDPA